MCGRCVEGSSPSLIGVWHLRRSREGFSATHGHGAQAQCTADATCRQQLPWTALCGLVGGFIMAGYVYGLAQPFGGPLDIALLHAQMAMLILPDTVSGLHGVKV